ncbi:MAG: sugar transferase [Chloroflexi bacterium]|nr:sugar transferase [Chloroflexota bacterium]
MGGNPFFRGKDGSGDGTTLFPPGWSRYAPRSAVKPGRRLAPWHQVLLDMAWTGIALLLADTARSIVPLGIPLDREPQGLAGTQYLTPQIWLVVGLVWLSVFLILGVYQPANRLSLASDLQYTARAVTFALLTFSSLIYLLKILNFSRLLFFYFYLFDMAGLGAIRAIASYLLHRGGAAQKRVLLVGAGEQRGAVVDWLANHPEYHLVGFIEGNVANFAPQIPGTVLGTFAEIGQLVMEHQVDEIIVTTTQRGSGTPAADGQGSPLWNAPDLVMDLQGQPVQVRIIPDLGHDLQHLDLAGGNGQRAKAGRSDANRSDAGLSRAEPGPQPIYNSQQPPIRGWNTLWKRGMDLVGASLGLVLFSPCLLIIAILIKLDSPGPVLFIQRRAGKYGNSFHMLKFRTMQIDAEAMLQQLIDLENLPEPVFKLQHDPRITRVGRWLRRYSLDELPQLINVLRGEMSLVGPRPEDVQIARRYSPWHKQRLLVRPGLTGAMQISGRADLSLEERVRLELSYMEHYSLWLDLKILLQTIPIVLNGKGSY